ncbi:hypothetical protein SASPL_153349 [Salvia splendens]|uniref:Uncharacterized protein n=1 Tax=Salvia splendens TaxID=180675 RepID=A0A8X8W515_SALSN|nr:hypothetical protein SASPL_153349 [Salvia splendens]
MAYAAPVSLESTIHRFLNFDLFSISVEEEQQITSLLEYVTPIREFLQDSASKKVVKETCLKLNKVDEFVEELPDDAKANSLKGRLREIVIELKDIYEFYKWEKTHRHFREKVEIVTSRVGQVGSLKYSLYTT